MNTRLGMEQVLRKFKFWSSPNPVVLSHHHGASDLAVWDKCLGQGFSAVALLTFCLNNLLLWELSCACLGCLEGSLVSTHYMLITVHHLPLVVTIKKISRHGQMSVGAK